MALWLSLDDLVRYLKMPKSTLYRLAQREALPGHKVGRTWRFDRDEVDAWIKSTQKRATRKREEVKSDGRQHGRERSS
jgi:excisionase family DNA binding protein